MLYRPGCSLYFPKICQGDKGEHYSTNGSSPPQATDFRVDFGASLASICTADSEFEWICLNE